MKRFVADYKGEIWNVETIYCNKYNTRLRVGRVDSSGQYHWELIFEKDVQISEYQESHRI